MRGGCKAEGREKAKEKEEEMAEGRKERKGSRKVGFAHDLKLF